MKSFADWTDEIKTLNNPPKLEAIDPVVDRGTDWMRGAQWDPADLASDKTVLTSRIMGKTATVMVLDELSRVDPEKLENFRRQYLGDWRSEHSIKPIENLSVSNARGRTHAYRVGTTVHQLMASMNHDHGLLIEPMHGFAHQRTRVRILDGYGTCIHEVVVE